MGALVEISALASRRPGPKASNDEIAAWYMGKGRLHEHLAREAGADVAREMALAAAAYAHGLAYENDQQGLSSA